MDSAIASLGIGAALIAGIAGSAHCFGMCGAMAGALGMRARTLSSSPSAAVGHTSLYHLGRLLGYAGAGAVSGSLGHAMQLVVDLVRIGAWLRVASGVLLVLISLRLFARWNTLAPIERMGARVWMKLQPLARQTAARSGVIDSLSLGFLWAWLPCGLVYSMLLYATVSGSAVKGAAIMAAFGLGTLPSMLTSSLFAAQLRGWLSAPRTRMVSGTLLALLGVWTVFAGFQHVGRMTHVHPSGVALSTESD